MIGFPGVCSWSSILAVQYPLAEGVFVGTTGDVFAGTCGYYTEYEWSGMGDVFYQIHSNNALASAISAFALAMVGSLLM